MSQNFHIDTGLIAQRFAKAASSYSEHAVAQKIICQRLIEMMRRHIAIQLPRVLELGCGSGHLTILLQKNFQIEQLILNDLYPEVRQHFSAAEQLDWCIGDIERLDFPGQLDAIMSSSVLQWMHDLEQVFKKCSEALKSQGWFCFSSFGSENLREIKTLTGQGLNYLSLEELKEKMCKSGFEVLEIQEEQETLYFEHPKQVLQHLKLTGVTATSSQHRWTKQSLYKFYDQYQQFVKSPAYEGIQQYPLTYHPIYCIARRVR